MSCITEAVCQLNLVSQECGRQKRGTLEFLYYYYNLFVLNLKKIKRRFNNANIWLYFAIVSYCFVNYMHPVSHVVDEPSPASFEATMRITFGGGTLELTNQADTALVASILSMLRGHWGLTP